LGNSSALASLATSSGFTPEVPSPRLLSSCRSSFTFSVSKSSGTSEFGLGTTSASFVARANRGFAPAGGHSDASGKTASFFVCSFLLFGVTLLPPSLAGDSAEFADLSRSKCASLSASAMGLEAGSTPSFVSTASSRAGSNFLGNSSALASLATSSGFTPEVPSPRLLSSCRSSFTFSVDGSMAISVFGPFGTILKTVEFFGFFVLFLLVFRKDSSYHTKHLSPSP